LDYTPEQILVSCGGKQSFFNLCQALLNSGDEVLIPAPYWVSYPDMALLADAVPVIIETGLEQNFKITAEQLSQNISDKTRLLVLNSPSNPTGVCYTEQELAAIGSVLQEHPNIIIASDDMYEHIIWADESYKTIAQVCPELNSRVVTLNGVSKAYSMTGWRIGYAAGPQDLIKAMTKVQSQSTSNACSISQAAALEALTGDQTCIQEMLVEFKKRHDYVVAALNEIPGVKAIQSQGAFYSFPNVEELIGQVEGVNDDVELTAYILDKAEVALVPGSAFGAPGYVRLSFATSMENLQESISRLKQLFG